MICTQLDRPISLTRVNTPQWAFAPRSGAGAAKAGGRFNRPGLHALYLSLGAPTALAEYKQTSRYLPPGTICTYLVTLPPLVDLRRLGEGSWDSLWNDWGIDWRAMALGQHVDPPTWDMGDLAIEAGSPGIIFPSTLHKDGVNLVLFLDALADAGGQIDVHDPDGMLPKNPASWS